jgi:hypothetical protein
MRGKKSYNIRNIEAHLNNFRPQEHMNTISNSPIHSSPSFLLTKNINNSIQMDNRQFSKINEYQQMQEYINAKYGVSKYASNLVSGKMFKSL